MRFLVALTLLGAPTAWAELPRLLSLLEVEGHSYEIPPSLRERERVALIEPSVFWSTDGLLCVLARGDAQSVNCQDTATGKREKRSRPRPVTLPVKSLSLGAAKLAQDGAITNDGVTKVAKLRCARSPLLDRKEYRYLPGPNGRLAVLVLEEDDIRSDCAELDAQCSRAGTLTWRVLVAVDTCP